MYYPLPDKSKKLETHGPFKGPSLNEGPLIENKYFSKPITSEEIHVPEGTNSVTSNINENSDYNSQNDVQQNLDHNKIKKHKASVETPTHDMDKIIYTRLRFHKRWEQYQKRRDF